MSVFVGEGHNRRFEKKMLKGLKAFKSDYRKSKVFLIYMGSETMTIDDITVLPMESALKQLPKILYSASII